jgi:hypothetical protein
VELGSSPITLAAKTAKAKATAASLKTVEGMNLVMVVIPPLLWHNV